MCAMTGLLISLAIDIWNKSLLQNEKRLKRATEEIYRRLFYC